MSKNQVSIKEEKLSDGSIAYNVIVISDDNDFELVIYCTDSRAAENISTALFKGALNFEISKL